MKKQKRNYEVKGDRGRLSLVWVTVAQLPSQLLGDKRLTIRAKQQREKKCGGGSDNGVDGGGGNGGGADVGGGKGSNVEYFLKQDIIFL